MYNKLLKTQSAEVTFSDRAGGKKTKTKNKRNTQLKQKIKVKKKAFFMIIINLFRGSAQFLFLLERTFAKKVKLLGQKYCKALS